MTKLVKLAVLGAVIAVVIGCGGGPQLTVSEYAEACGSLAVRFERVDLVFESADASEALEDAEDAVSDLRKLNPPDELKRLHDLRVDAMDLTLKVLNDVGLIELAENIRKFDEDAEDLSESEARKRMSEIEEQVEEIDQKMGELEQRAEELDVELEGAVAALSSETREILEAEGCD